MLRKFECFCCHSRFEADDESAVQCPNCGSDNVEYAHFHLPNGWWKWMLLLVIVLGIFIIIHKFNRTTRIQQVPEEMPHVILDTSPLDLENNHEDGIVMDKTPIIIAEKPHYTSAGYTLDVEVKNAPNCSFYVALCEYNGTRVVSRSEDGKHFSGVPASEKYGIYDVIVFLTANDSILCDALHVTGFESQEMVTDVMTKEKLQTLIEDVDSNLTGAEDWLSSTDSRPSTLSDVQTRLDLLWNNVSITDVKYDANNRITDIYIEVQE